MAGRRSGVALSRETFEKVDVEKNEIAGMHARSCAPARESKIVKSLDGIPRHGVPRRGTHAERERDIPALQIPSSRTLTCAQRTSNLVFHA